MMMYSNPDVTTLHGVIVEGSTIPVAFFRHREDAEVFVREGFFFPYDRLREAQIITYELKLPYLQPKQEANT